MSPTERLRGLRQRGVTLIEVILFMLIVGIAAGAILMLFANTTRSSADPLIRKQALAIAESLLDEVRLMPFTWCDPDDPQAATATSSSDCTVPEATGPEAGESRYATLTPFDNVNDYDGFSMDGIRDIGNQPIAGLEGYRAAVAVAALTMPGLAAGEALQITVSVTGPANTTVTLDGVRTRYAPNP